MLNWLVEEKGIAPHIPVFDKSKRDDGTFRGATFDMTQPGTFTTARVVSGLGRAVPCTRARPFCIVPASSTAMYARSNRSAAQRNHHARSRAISMSMPETLPGRSLAPRASELSASAQEDRDEVRTLEAHPEAWSAPIARPARCPG